jgi:histidine phosphotransferase ChpT
VADADFAALLCSRLCHDLISPVGALTNGVELLADETDPDMRAQCLQLLADSARQTANRLKFFRLAFGAAGGFGADVDTREVHGAIDGLFGSGKTTLDWQVTAPALPKAATKMMLNMALLTGDALLRGGTLTVACEVTDDMIDIATLAAGPKVLLGEDLRSALLGQTPEAEVQARVAPAFLVHLLAQSARATLNISPPAGDQLALGVRIPR